MIRLRTWMAAGLILPLAVTLAPHSLRAADDLAWPDEEIDAPAPRRAPKAPRTAPPHAKPPTPPKAPARPTAPAAPRTPGTPGAKQAPANEARAPAAHAAPAAAGARRGAAAGQPPAARPGDAAPGKGSQAARAAGARATAHEGAAAAPAQGRQDEDDGEDEEDQDDEDVETVEDVQADGGGSAAGASKGGAQVTVGANDEGWTLRKVAGHLHAAAVHLPIAWWMAWAGAEALALFWPHAWLVTSGLPLGAITSLGFAPSVYSGLMRLEELAGGNSGYDTEPALWHRNLLLAAWTLSVVALALRLANVQRRHTAGRVAYLSLVFGGFALMAYSAHLGGVLVYGEEFFPF